MSKVIGARSISGCWTCRLRKKKCDEGHPACFTCLALGLGCDGYGQKPQWMDGGQMESELVQLIKQRVKKTTTQNRRLGLLRAQQMRQHNQISPAPNLANEYTPLPYTAPNIVQLISDDTVEEDGLLRSGLESAIYSPGIFESYAFSLEQSAPATILQTPSESLQQSPHIIRPTIPSICQQPGVGSLISLDDHGAHGTNLLMHFLDYVFPIQFPFYSPSPIEGGRGWLLYFLMPETSLYHAVLSVSAYHQQLLLPQHNDSEQRKIALAESQHTHIAFALEGMRRYINDYSRNREEIGRDYIFFLGCTIQLIYFKLFQGGIEGWQIHLRAASTIITDLGSRFKLQTVPPLPVQSTPAMLDGQPHVDTETNRGFQPSTTEVRAVRFFTTAFIWLDILSCVSLRAKPSIEIHEHLIEDSSLQFKTLMGCENWVMVLIIKISALDEWKKESERHGRRLSMMELVRRATKIEECLKNKLAYNPMNFDPPTPHSNSSRTTHSEKFSGYSSVVTRIFARSTLTYLYVVISGAYPELQEIRESVEATIASFRELPHAWLLSSLVWPFCITGCLALKEQQFFFRDLVARAGMNENISSTCQKALQVMEECWRMRENELGSCDWTDAMNSLGWQVLLV
ncbi:hypothetical protein OIDMADRAFT_185052 [Oidiodendron maius Zn]|uniref:Zn(2)-C6 fungal-type domain-containing protein n=1 Tax=Oidiodendron maius (strain Zn) TaxID=913774 RepID=A0A0C3CST7_OIDMZ|nr:hypothetical protein OIDMADRAFT_185052 [Oidiodendron maius Zn]